MKRRLFSLLLTGVMLLSMCPPGLALGPDGMIGGLCPHHTEHSFEDCGYVEAVEEIACDIDCTETGENGQIIHAEGCAYAPAVEGQPCGYICRICPVQTMIDALPAPEDITPDNRAEIEAQLDAIDVARLELTDEEIAALDITRYAAAVSALAALDGQAGADVPVPVAGGDVTYLYCESNGQNWQTGTKSSGEYTTVTASDTIWNAGWYVASGNVTISSRVTVTGGVHLILVDGCVLTVGGGIQVQDDDTNIDNGSLNSLTIYGQSGDTGKLDSGKSDNSKAGIGGDKEGAGGVITINGGTVTATGGDWAAGIGGGDGGSQNKNGHGGNITINGGTVTAIGGSGNACAGIGGGNHGVGGKVTINGGTVRATGGGDDGAGIGGGALGLSDESSRYGGDVTINGGTVTAEGKGGGAGIGCAGDGFGGTVTINGGTVTSTGGSNGAGIGGSGGSNITINGGTVIAIGGHNGAGIGGKQFSDGGNTTINGGTVTATGGDNGGAGIGGGGPGVGNNGSGAAGTFSTGTDGSAVIAASSIRDKTNQNNWSGVIFQGNAGQVYGSPITLTTNAEIPDGKTLTIPENSTLTIGNGVTLTNNGTINVEPGGNLVGEVTGSGTINLPPPAEQFPTLIPGGTYWFDLSGAGIRGSVNSGGFGAFTIPDTTLHWVPFIYVHR